MMDMSYIDSFLSKYKDNRIKYRGTLLYGLKKFLHFLFDNGFCEIDYVEDILSLRILRNGHVPHTWTQDELKSLLGAIDRQSPTGKEIMLFYLFAFKQASEPQISGILKSVI